jgi:hypothetical protein
MPEPTRGGQDCPRQKSQYAAIFSNNSGKALGVIMCRTTVAVVKAINVIHYTVLASEITGANAPLKSLLAVLLARWGCLRPPGPRRSLSLSDILR